MIRPVCVLLLLAVFAPLHAQINTDGPIKMNPDLALAFPLVQVQHDVTVKFPVLLNVNTVIKPGMILRNLYTPPANEDSVNLGIAHHGNMENSYSRAPSTTDDASQMPPEMAHYIEGQRRVEWEVVINFQLALAQLPTDTLHLIYSRTNNTLNLEDQRFNFFDGMFLGSPSGGVSVLGVEIDSKAEAAGIKAGDTILAVGKTPMPPDLTAFPTIYFGVRKEAEDSHATSFPVTIRSPGENGSHVVNVATPPTIKSMLMQGL